jgi:hypothetical protein
VCVGASLLAILAVSSRAQEQPPTDPAELQKVWEEFGKPTEEHEAFKFAVGKWKTVMKDFQQNAAEPNANEGTAEFRLLMDGRYLEQDFEGTFQGQTFEGKGIMAYDKAQKKYVSTWIDNMSTGIIFSEGRWLEDKGQFVEEGKMATPFGEVESRTVWQHVDDDKFTLTMYVIPPNQPEVKAMEITYTRQD